MRSKGGHAETKNISRARKIVVKALSGKNLCDINSQGFQKNEKHLKIAPEEKNGVENPFGGFGAAGHNSKFRPPDSAGGGYSPRDSASLYT